MTDQPNTLPTAELITMAQSDRGTWVASGPQLNALLQPLNPARVASRTQGNNKLSYVEAWDIKRMLIRIFGFANWSADVTESKILRITEADEPVMNWENGKPVSPKILNGVPVTKHMFTVLAQATMKLTIHASGATYTETAAASQKGPDIGEVTDFALKTAESDALKRAAINLGSQFGLSLYDNGSTQDVVGRIMDDHQRITVAGYRTELAEKLAQQQADVAAGKPVGANPEDNTPMALADYNQGDPNENDQLGAPAGTGRSAVAGAFQRGRAKGADAGIVGPPVNSIAGAEHYSGESFGDK